VRPILVAALNLLAILGTVRAHPEPATFKHPALPGEAPHQTTRRLHTWALALDAGYGHSRRPAWRALMGWHPPLFTWLTWQTEATERGLGRYAHPEGRTRPDADFTASVLLSQLDPQFSCRFPLRAEYLRRARILPGPTPFAAGRCAEFEAWARPDEVAAIELIFASPSWREPATTAGHLLFRLKPGAPGPGLPAERVFSYGVHRGEPPKAPDNPSISLIDPDHSQAQGNWPGLIGALRGSLLVEHQRDLLRRYALAERRDLFAYTLRLSPAQRRLLLAVFWQQHRTRSHGPYAFLSTNCARMADDALRAVLPELPPRRGWYFHPHEVVTRALAAQIAEPAGVTWSRRSLARQAEATLGVLEADPLSPLAAPTPLARSPSPEDLTILTGWLGTAPELSPDARATLTAWADAQLDLALFEADAAAAEGAYEEATSTPLLEAALQLRARLPAAYAPRLAPPEPHALPTGGTRRAALGFGVDQAGQPTGRLRAGLIDEQPGEARAVALRRTARFELLVSDNRLRIRTDARPTWVETRLTLLHTTELGRHVRRTDGDFGSRLNPLLDTGVGTLPEAGVPFGGWLRLGLAVHLLDLSMGVADTGFLSLGPDLNIESWATDGEPISATGGLHGELVLPTPGAHHQLRLRGRVGGGYALGGPRLRAEALARLDLLLWPAQGLQLLPYGRLRHGQVGPNGYEAGLALGW
jgi:hypothetical protein